MSQSTSPLGALRRPEHTGENRCLPCTVVNVVIAALLGGALAVASVPLGVAVFVVSALVIYLRGYLVPYTPTLTTRYLPEPVLRSFGKDTDPEPTDITYDAVEELEYHREHAVDIDAFLDDVGVVEPRDGGPTGYRLTPAFREAVDEELEALDGVDSAAVATLFGEDADAVSERDRDYPAYEVGIRIRKWPSEPALRFDVATDRALAARTDRWRAVPTEQRVEILGLLRASRETCPVCGGELSETSETVDSCCVSVEKYAYRCSDCDTHLREYDDPTQLNGKGLTGA